MVQDTKLKTSFITLTGALSNGFPIEMRTSVEGIKESVGITNQFLLISGAVTLLVSLLLVFFFSRRVHPGPSGSCPSGGQRGAPGLPGPVHRRRPG